MSGRRRNVRNVSVTGCPAFDEDWIEARLGEQAARVGNQFEGGWVRPEPRDIRAYQHVAIGGAVHYVRNKQTHFVDYGCVSSYQSDDPVSSSVRFNLRCRSGPRGFVISGSDAFKIAVVKAAIETGAAKRIQNPELPGVDRDRA